VLQVHVIITSLSHRKVEDQMIKKTNLQPSIEAS
jgi:hypothetical protein